MKKILITGASGFVGGHFIRFLKAQEPGYEIHAISRRKPEGDFLPGPEYPGTTAAFHQADLSDSVRITTLIEKIQPDYLLHLAAQSSVAESWNTPSATFLNNISIFLNIIEAVRLRSRTTRILSVGSSEQYGTVREPDLPVREDKSQQPSNPYAVARVAQEELAMVYRNGYDLDICCTRSFNHCGPGQTDRFVASAIAKQFAGIRLGLQDPVVEIGDGSVIRDFLDVRDVVAAYFLILEKGIAGQVYNVCSGRGYAINDLVTLLSGRLEIPVRIHQNQMKLRPQDNPRMIGCPEKIQNELGWQPHIPLADSMEEMAVYWENILKQNREK
jgi:GDP-4-dehydro-6-deoxy-D-mannose reductase